MGDGSESVHGSGGGRTHVSTCMCPKKNPRHGDTSLSGVEMSHYHTRIHTTEIN